MSPELIKNIMLEKGYTPGMFAEVLGKSPSLISKVIHGKAKSQEVAKAISKALNMELNELFPNQYLLPGKSYKDTDEYKVKMQELKKILE